VTDEASNRVFRINTSNGLTWILVRYTENEALEWLQIPKYDRFSFTSPDIEKASKQTP